MNQSTKPFIVLILLFFLPLAAEEKCKYSYEPSQTSIEWTAFKFTEKTGVKGTFETIQVTKTKKANTVLDSLKDLKFSIKTDSINSKNPDRDQKIKQNFFGSVSNGREIKGNFTDIVGTTAGTANLNIDFNKKKKAFPVNFSIIDDQIEVTGEVDVILLGLENGLAKLNEVCLDLHKGSDGKSKLWPTVAIKVSSKLSKKCGI